jgi:hypothetical protein
MNRINEIGIVIVISCFCGCGCADDGSPLPAAVVCEELDACRGIHQV